MNPSSFDSLFANKTVRVSLIAAAVLAALLLLAHTFAAFDNLGRSEYPVVNTITVTGEGSATAIPDTANVWFSIRETATQAADAQTKVTARVDAALALLKEQGVAEKDIKTTSYNISPHYEYKTCPLGAMCPSNGTITGYDVAQTISVKVRDTEKVGAILGALGKANVSDLSGPDFVLDDADAVQAQARGEAIDEARARAKVLAKQLGVSLGDVVSFSENGGSMPIYAERSAYGMGGAMDVKVATPSIPSGENEYKASVSITYEIH